MKRRRTLEDVREAAWAALEEDPSQALRLAREALRQHDDAEGRYLLAHALLATDDAEGGRRELGKAVEADPTHADAWATLGRILFEDCQWEGARSAVGSCLRLDPHHPEGRYYRACLRERRGDHDGAARDYAVAAAEDPEGYPEPLALDDETIASVTGEVLGLLPPPIQEILTDVPILVEEVPDEELLDDFEPPMTPADLVACFSGPSLTERTTLGGWSTLPATITIFRRNLARMASTREGAVEELRITLLHEIGHFLGLDEEQLERRGLE